MFASAPPSSGIHLTSQKEHASITSYEFYRSRQREIQWKAVDGDFGGGRLLTGVFFTSWAWKNTIII